MGRSENLEFSVFFFLWLSCLVSAKGVDPQGDRILSSCRPFFFSWLMWGESFSLQIY